MRRIPLRLWLLVAFSAILQTLPFPIAGPTPLWRTAFSWIALWPLLTALLDTDQFGRPPALLQTTMLGYFCGFLWYLGDCYWIYQTMHLYGGLPPVVAGGVLVLFCLYLGLYHALFGLLVGVLRRSRLGIQGTLLCTPFVWVTVEFARAHITVFPWDLLGMTQVDNPVLIHLAPFTGAYGLSFVIVAVNALWLVRLRANGRSYKLPLGAVVVLAIVVSHVLQLRQQKAPNHLGTANSATLVQENLSVGAEAKGVHESPDRLIDSFNELSLYPPVDRCRGSSELPRTDCFQSGSRGGGSPVPTDLIAWPESPSGFRSDDPYFHAGLAALARTANAPLVIGSLGVVPDAMVVRGVRVYNSAIFVSGDGAVEGRYDKIHLVPWGEYVPFRSFFFFAKRLTAGVGDMDRGSKRVVFRADGHTYGVFICYESIFGDEVREFVKSGAEVLVNISDDGWFGDTSAPWQHLNMVRMRAIENHRWILRSTNTGVTAAIDPYGRVTAVAPRHIRTALHTGFNFDRETPFYTIHGDLFAYACAVFTALALVSSSLQWAGATVPS